MAITTTLVSVSTDGKVLLWRQSDKLRYPIKGHLLGRKRGAEFSVVGGTSMGKVQVAEDNTFIVGTEGGSIFKCTIT